VKWPKTGTIFGVETTIPGGERPRIPPAPIATKITADHHQTNGLIGRERGYHGVGLRKGASASSPLLTSRPHASGGINVL
jgi:hypothetical protein